MIRVIVLLQVLVLSGCIMMTPSEYANSNTHVANPAPIKVINDKLEYNHIIKDIVISGKIKNISNKTLYQTTVVFDLFNHGNKIGTVQYQIPTQLSPMTTEIFIARIPPLNEAPTHYKLSESFAVYINDK